MPESIAPWTQPVAVTEIPETGAHYEISAAADVRAAIASAAGLRDLPELSAVFDLALRGEAITVRGEVNARVGQTCVVTLEPIENDIHEIIDLVFAPESSGREGDGDNRKKNEPPEPLRNGIIDLGILATEFLMLGVNPYPRKPGVQFTRPPSGNEGPNPFAALATLKKSS